MIIASWNYRGTTTKGFVSLIKDLRREYGISMFFLHETHCGGNRASKLAGRMGFQQSFIIDASGHSGGIWCLWDPSCWTVGVLCSNTQYVHMEVRWKNENRWYLTAVYASPRY